MSGRGNSGFYRGKIFSVLAVAVILISCGGGSADGGDAGSSGTDVSLAARPAPTLSLSVNPSSVVSGGAATLVWSSTRAKSCTASGAWSGSKATSGSQSTGALTATSTYSLSCTGNGGSATKSVTVNVTAPAPPPGGVITPDDPGAADMRITVSSANAQPISPFIYGINGWPNNANRNLNLTLARMGGNRLTAYNWENNASNAGTDWFNQNDNLLVMDMPAGAQGIAGEAARVPVQSAFDANGAIIVTVPMAGYVAADKNGGGDVNQTPNYLATRFRVSTPKKGAAFSYPPDTSDANVYQDEFVWWLESKFPNARSDARRTIFYSLDNEPDLWANTHPRIHPAKVTYAELRDRTLAYATAIKDVAPTALVFGPVSYGWNGFVTLQDAPDASGRDFLNYYLQELANAHQAQNRRLVDVLDLHWYPEAQGGGVRITDDSASAAVAAARIQAPRSLWDSSYTETSWITQWSTQGPIRLIPRLRDKIDAHYPGTRLAFTEYYYGGGADISGGIAQADVLGIFGREDVFAATLWHMGSTDDRFIHAAFAMFRNYDGGNGTFGDSSISATSTSTAAESSVYASVDAADPTRMVLVMINKTAASRSAGVAITHTRRFTRAEVYRLTAAAATPQRLADQAITLTNAFVHTLPPMSVTTLVLRP